AQGYDALDFFDKRGEIQRNAADYITDALNSYGVQSIQTLMTNIDLPDELEALLRERQILQQKAENYKQEQLTEQQRQSLIKQQVINDAQAESIKAQQNLEITNFNTQAYLIQKKAEAQVQQINNQVDLERQQQELDMKAAYEK
ncbi:MAG: SPFH domain-containing protein, partial [Dolichospermum sp.]